MQSALKLKEKMSFEGLLKDVMLVVYLTDGGIWCQRRGVEIEKARSPVRVWDLGILHKMPFERMSGEGNRRISVCLEEKRR